MLQISCFNIEIVVNLACLLCVMTVNLSKCTESHAIQQSVKHVWFWGLDYVLMQSLMVFISNLDRFHHAVMISLSHHHKMIFFRKMFFGIDLKK